MDALRTPDDRFRDLPDFPFEPRYVELEGRLEKVLSVVKMRTSAHDTSIWRYTIAPTGAVVGEPLDGYEGILTGAPVVRAQMEKRPTGRKRKR